MEQVDQEVLEVGDLKEVQLNQQEQEIRLQLAHHKVIMEEQVLKLHQQLQIIIKVEEVVELLQQELQEFFLDQLVQVEQDHLIQFQVQQFLILEEVEEDLISLVFQPEQVEQEVVVMVQLVQLRLLVQQGQLIEGAVEAVELEVQQMEVQADRESLF